MKRRTSILLILVFALISVFMISCARDSSPATQAPAPSAPAAPAPAAPAPAPAPAPASPSDVSFSDYADGVYFAMEEGFSNSGWKYTATLVIEDGKLVDVDWNGVNINGGASKKDWDKAGKYNMVRFGGAQAEWYEQAEKTEAHLIATQDLGITYSSDAGHTDEIAGVSVHVVELYDLIGKALEAGPVGVGPYVDGSYFAISDTYPNSGWKEYVSLTVINGRIAAANWSAVNKQGIDKKTHDRAGNYNMVRFGGAMDEWYVQAARAEAHLLDIQDPSAITYVDDAGHTDDIAGISIHVDALFTLAEKALEAGPVEIGPYADGGYYASEEAFSSSGWKGFVSLFVKDGNIVNVFWSAVNQAGEDKKAFDMAGNYQMVARGGAIDEWYVQAVRTEAHLLETQDPKAISYKDANGHTDDIAGVTIHVNDFYALVEKALAAGPRR